ncbi:MAG: NUDIX domain-containing protein [Balneolaceae bacterium]
MVQKKRIEAAGGVIFQPDGLEGWRVVLIYRRGVWDLPKGKKDEGESFQECCLRELHEETGVSDMIIKDVLTDTIHEYDENGVMISKLTRWFAVEAEKDKVEFIPQREEQIESVEWFSLPEAKGRVGYDNLRDVLEKFEVFLKN